MQVPRSVLGDPHLIKIDDHASTVYTRDECCLPWFDQIHSIIWFEFPRHGAIGEDATGQSLAQYPFADWANDALRVLFRHHTYVANTLITPASLCIEDVYIAPSRHTLSQPSHILTRFETSVIGHPVCFKPK